MSDNNSRGKYLFKNVKILVVSNFASKILAFLLVPLYTSVLSKDEVGIYDLIVSTVSLLYPIFTLNIVDGVMRFSMDLTRSKNEIVAIAIRYIGFSWIMGGCSLILLRITKLLPQIEGLEIYIFIYYTSYILYHLLLQFAKGLERVTDMGVAGVIATVAMIGGNVLFLIVIKIGLKGFILAYILAQLFPLLYLFVRLRFWQNIKGFHINKTLKSEMVAYCIPLIATTIGWWVNSTSDKYVVTLMVGVGANGLLSVAYKIPQIINTLQGIFIQAWQISAIKEYGEEDTKSFYGRTFCILNLLMCIACTLLIISTKPLGHILYQKEFYTAWHYAPFLLIACVFNSASGILGPILSAKKASKPMAMSAICGASANVVMNIAFVYFIGIQGATIATVISSFIIYAVRKRAIGYEIKIDNYGVVLITWFLLCVQAILEIYTPFWWVEVILICIILLFNKNGLKQILKMGKQMIRWKTMR